MCSGRDPFSIDLPDPAKLVEAAVEEALSEKTVEKINAQVLTADTARLLLKSIDVKREACELVERTIKHFVSGPATKAEAMAHYELVRLSHKISDPDLLEDVLAYLAVVADGTTPGPDPRKQKINTPRRKI